MNFRLVFSSYSIIIHFKAYINDILQIYKIKFVMLFFLLTSSLGADVDVRNQLDRIMNVVLVLKALYALL